jgi:hypothetical protein
MMKIAADGLTVGMFDGDISHQASMHTFFAPESTVSLTSAVGITLTNDIQATLEYRVLNEIQKNVLSRFVDGLPPHRHPSALRREYDPEASSIFVCKWDDFKQYKASDVQEIFRHRHILVHNGPVETVDFDLEGLEILGSLSAEVSLQGRIVNPFLWSRADELNFQLRNSGRSQEKRTCFEAAPSKIYNWHRQIMQSDEF